MTESKTGLITVALNDAALISSGMWYPALEEFQIGELPPGQHHLWTLGGLTYPLKFEMPDGTAKSWRGRVYTMPSSVLGGVRFKVWHDPVPKSEKPLKGKMSPALQRLGDLLEADKTVTTKFMRDVFSMTEKGSIRLGDITDAVRGHLDDGLGKPTPKQALERIRADKARKRKEKQAAKGSAAGSPGPTPVATPEEPAGRIKRERTHKSVWEIRN